MPTATPWLCPVAFGAEGRAALDLFLTCYAKSGSTWPVCILSDEEPIPTPPGVCCAPYVGAWPENCQTTAMRKAGAIKIAARRALTALLGQPPGPLVACDLDMVIQRPLDPLADLCAGACMACGPNAWSTTYAWWPEVIDELNTGLIWLADDAPSAEWERLWPWAYRIFQPIREIPYSDEIVQTVVLRRLQGLILDRRWNLSHRLLPAAGDLHPDAAVIHFHGPNKPKLAAYASRYLAGA